MPSSAQLFQLIITKKSHQVLAAQLIPRGLSTLAQSSGCGEAEKSIMQTKKLISLSDVFDKN